MKLKLVLILVVLGVVTGCNNNDAAKQKELELKEKELAIKEQELKLKEADKEKEKEKAKLTAIQGGSVEANTQELPAGKKDGLSDIENLIGYWFIPHAASINIKFTRDGKFEFNDYNETLGKDELLSGNYQLQSGTLTLLYSDRPKQSFRFYKGEGADDNYYIKKGDYYFVKGENGSK